MFCSTRGHLNTPILLYFYNKVLLKTVSFNSFKTMFWHFCSTF